MNASFYLLYNEKIKFDSKEITQRDDLVREAHASNVLFQCTLENSIANLDYCSSQLFIWKLVRVKPVTV